jgi:hypothetical protein
MNWRARGSLVSIVWVASGEEVRDHSLAQQRATKLVLACWFTAEGTSMLLLLAWLGLGKIGDRISVQQRLSLSSRCSGNLFGTEF